MYKPSDLQPRNSTRARTGKCSESKRREITSALANGKPAAIKHRGVSHSLASLTPARAANDTAFWSGGQRDFT